MCVVLCENMAACVWRAGGTGATPLTLDRRGFGLASSGPLVPRESRATWACALPCTPLELRQSTLYHLGATEI